MDSEDRPMPVVSTVIAVMKMIALRILSLRILTS